MAKQRQSLTQHLKEIQSKKRQTKLIIKQIQEEIKEELDVIKDNEQTFLKMQLEE